MKTELESKFELYKTPNWAIESIFKLYNPMGMNVLEPGCDTAPHCEIAKTLGATSTTGVDLRMVGNAMCDNFVNDDFLSMHHMPIFNMVSMNPPFSSSVQFVENALKCITSDGIIVCLQRLNWLSSVSRKEFWERRHLSSVHIFSRRPSFKGGPTDAQEYAYFVFRKRAGQNCILGWI